MDPNRLPRGIVADELKGYGRRIAEIEWLLAALVLLAAQFIQPAGPVLVAACACFAVFVLAFHYLGPQRLYNRTWPLAVDIAAMTAFITAVVWVTGGLSSPLMGLYFLSAAACALVFPRASGLWGAAAASGGYVLLYAFEPPPGPELLSRSVIGLFALWLIAMLTSRLSDEKHQARQRVHLLSRTDDLTGLWNMRMFGEQAAREQRRSKRYGRPFAIAMIDADELKPVNDRFGHQAGSRFIQHLGEVLRDNLRGSDVLARYGGDEFVLLLPETDAAGAASAMERLRARLRSRPMRFDGHTVAITVSVGIAAYPTHGREYQQVLRLADRALYRSKKGGKDRVSVAETPRAVAVG